MSSLYRINLKQSSDKGITLNTTKLNVLLDRRLDPDIYIDQYKEEVDLNKILSLPYKLGCISNKYNKCNLYVNNRECRRILLDIQNDSKRKLYALIFPDVYIIMPEDIFEFLEIDNSSIGKTYFDEFKDTFNQHTMNMDLISTKQSKLQININKINQSLYEDDELNDVFNMYSTKITCKELEQANNKELEKVLDTPVKKKPTKKKSPIKQGK